MATPSIQGLFGGMGTPEEMQRAMLEQKAAQFAEMNQNQQLSSMAYKGGANLGQGLAGAFGVDIQDPTIQRATRLRQLASQYNTNTAKGLRDMAASLQATDPESAFQLTQRAMAMDKAALDARKGEAEITLKEAETTAKLEERKTPDQKNAYDIVSNDPLVIAGSPQFKKNYVETLKALTAKTITAQVDKVGVAESTREPVYFDKTTNEQFTVKDGKRIPFSGGIDQTTSKNTTSLDIGAVFDKARAAGDAKAQSEAWGKAGDTYKSQVALTGKLDRVVADLPSTFTGSFANGSLQIAKVASGLGIPVDTNRITNTEYLNSVTSELVRTIARDFPGSQSNAELQQLLLSKPSSPQQWQTILRLLQDVQRQTKAGTITYEKLAKMPQEERFKVDYNLENGQVQKKLARSDDLTARVRAGTASVEEAQELKKLRGELQ